MAQREGIRLQVLLEASLFSGMARVFCRTYDDSHHSVAAEDILGLMANET